MYALAGFIEGTGHVSAPFTRIGFPKAVVDVPGLSGSRRVQSMFQCHLLVLDSLEEYWISHLSFLSLVDAGYLLGG